MSEPIYLMNLRRTRLVGTVIILVALSILGLLTHWRVHIERVGQLYTLLLLLACIGGPLLWLLWNATKPPKRERRL